MLLVTHEEPANCIERWNTGKHIKTIALLRIEVAVCIATISQTIPVLMLYIFAVFQTIKLIL